MDKVHLWKGEWIDDDGLRERLSRLEENIREDLARGMDLPALLDALDALGGRLAAKGRLYGRLRECALGEGGLSPSSGRGC